MKILLTGASGLLGRSLIPLLVVNEEVFSIGRNPIPRTMAMPPIDLATPWDSGLLPEQVDVVIHLAQSARYRDFPHGAQEVFAVNLAATAQLLDYALRAGAKRFILASTGGIYRAGSDTITEDSEILGPSELGHYFATKLSAEMLAGNYRQFMDIHVLRIFFMYGSGQRKEMFLPALIQRIKKGVPVQLNGPEGIQINPVHVQDAAKTVSTLARVGGPKTLNIAGPDVISIRAIAEQIGQLLEIQPMFDIVEEAKDLIASVNPMINLIGIHDISFSSGLKTIVNENIERSGGFAHQ